MAHPPRLLLENIFEPSDVNHWRLKMINAFLVLTALVFSFFAVFNLFVTGLYANAGFDLLGLAFMLFIRWVYRRTKNIDITASLVVVNVALMSLGIILISEKTYGILMWSFFTPIFAFFLKGTRKGLILIALYYATLFTYLVTVLGEQISMHHLVEMTAVSTALVAIVFYFEMSRQKAFALLQTASIEDPLTGLYNRRHFNTVYPREYHRCRRTDCAFALSILDLDHFKQYNDRYGHLQGDEALKAVAHALRKELKRSSDFVFRIGGEEFALVLSGESCEQLEAAVDNVRKVVEELDIEHPDNKDKRITASFGLVCVRPDEQGGIDKLYAQADRALYRAKEAGRNRVVRYHLAGQEAGHPQTAD